MNTIHNAIMAEYEKRRAAARASLLERQNEVYAEIPEIRAIDDKTARTGLQRNMDILRGGAGNAGVARVAGAEGAAGVVGAARKLEMELSALTSDKRKLLVSNGYPPDYLETVHTCRHCGDTGYIQTATGSAKCRCYLQQMVNIIFEQSNLKIAGNNNFACFDEGLYPDAVNEAKYGIRISPRNNIRLIKKRCLDFIADFTTAGGKSLFFSGPAGTGKTFMCNCIAVDLIKRGTTVLYQTSPTLFNTIAEYKMRSFKDGYLEDNDDSPYKQIFEVELLMIDDLGTESPSAARYAELLTILDTRQLNNLSRPCRTIISTNIGIRELYEYYDERNASRIVGGFDMLKFAGDDIRVGVSHLT